jgi:hypothetical protein
MAQLRVTGGQCINIGMFASADTPQHCKHSE